MCLVRFPKSLPSISALPMSLGEVFFIAMHAPVLFLTRCCASIFGYEDRHYEAVFSAKLTCLVALCGDVCAFDSRSPNSPSGHPCRLLVPHPPFAPLCFLAVLCFPAFFLSLPLRFRSWNIARTPASRFLRQGCILTKAGASGAFFFFSLPPRSRIDQPLAVSLVYSPLFFFVPVMQ